MRLTKEQLKQIIKEELEAVMTEDPLYGPTGETRVLNPNDESDYEEFAKSGIRDPKAVAAKRLKDMNIAKPEREEMKTALREQRQTVCKLQCSLR